MSKAAFAAPDVLHSAGMPTYKLKDAQAKDILRTWPMATKTLWSPPGGEGAWVRAQPQTAEAKAAGPKIFAPGARLFGTQPDGMWAYFNGVESCDLIVIEVCGSIQNLNDKRSRYMPSSHSLVLRVSSIWAEEEVKGRGGPGGSMRPRREWAGTLPKLESDTVNVPVRFLRVLYALSNEHYKVWLPEHTPTGYEFFIPHSSLGTYNRPETQTFLKGMSIASQFHTQPKNVRLPASARASASSTLAFDCTATSDVQSHSK